MNFYHLFEAIVAGHDSPPSIEVTYDSSDGAHHSKKFNSIEAAKKWAIEWIGENPEIGSSYAVSQDGIGKISVKGISIAELLGDENYFKRAATKQNHFKKFTAIQRPWTSHVTQAFAAAGGKVDQRGLVDPEGPTWFWASDYADWGSGPIRAIASMQYDGVKNEIEIKLEIKDFAKRHNEVQDILREKQTFPIQDNVIQAMTSTFDMWMQKAKPQLQQAQNPPSQPRF